MLKGEEGCAINEEQELVVGRLGKGEIERESKASWQTAGAKKDVNYTKTGGRKGDKSQVPDWGGSRENAGCGYEV